MANTDWFKESHEEWCREHNQPVPVWEDDTQYPNCTHCGGWMESVTKLTDKTDRSGHAIWEDGIHCARCKTPIAG